MVLRRRFLKRLTAGGVESDSGRLLWEYPFPHVGTDQNMPTPVFHQGRVLLGGENRGVCSLEPRSENGAWTVQQRWHQKKVSLDMSSAVINGDLLYGFSHYDKGRLFCLDTRTGEVLRQGPGRTGENVAFLSIPGHVVALINDGELQIAQSRCRGIVVVCAVENAPCERPWPIAFGLRRNEFANKCAARPGGVPFRSDRQHSVRKAPGL